MTAIEQLVDSLSPRDCNLSIKVADLPEGASLTGIRTFQPQHHIQVWTRQSREQKIGAQMLYAGLRAAGKTLLNGKGINSQADALRWVLEQIATSKAPIQKPKTRAKAETLTDS